MLIFQYSTSINNFSIGLLDDGDFPVTYKIICILQAQVTAFKLNEIYSNLGTSGVCCPSIRKTLQNSIRIKEMQVGSGTW